MEASNAASWPEIAGKLDDQAEKLLDTLEGIKGNVYLYRIGELSATAAILAVEQELDRLGGSPPLGGKSHA